MKTKSILLVGCFSLACIASVQGQSSNINKVNLFMGTSGDHGQVSPAAAAPFGMVAVGPDSSPRQHAGYNYAVTKTSGISVNRLSGVGCGGCGGNLSIRPADYEQTLNRCPDTEKAIPGYYTVTFDNGSTVHLTASERVAVEKYHFSPNQKRELFVDFSSSFTGATSQHLVVNNNEIQGVVRSPNTCGTGTYQLAFSLQANHPFTYSPVSKSRVKLSFRNVADVEVRIGLSSLSPIDAASEVQSLTSFTFDQIREQATAKWNTLLSKVDVQGGTPDERVIFYTSLYRTCLSPHEVAPTGRYYRATDGNIHLAETHPFYSSWSIWDTFRTKYTLLTLIAPERMQDMARSLLYLYRNGKASWSTDFEPTPTVRTEHTGILLLDCYRRGLTDMDFNIAYSAMKDEVEKLSLKSPDQQIEAIGDWWALSQIAGILNKKEDETLFRERAEQLFESVWKKEFMTITNDFSKMGGNGLYQGTRWQYRWAAPFYMNKMIEWVGREKLVEQLSYFFEHSLYNQGNEPDIHTPYIFNKLGRPDLTQNIVTRLLTDDKMVHIYGGNAEFKTPFVGRAFQNLPEGYMPEMDEDDGTMSAWYAFSAMGLYPLTVGSDEYELTPPLFDRVTIHLSEGKTFTIEAKGRKKANAKVKRLLFNGKKMEQFCIRHSDLSEGGVLSFIY